MRKMLFDFYLISFSFVTTFGCSSPEERADSLFNKAAELIKQGQELEQESYTKALSKYETAAKNLQKIISNYPETPIAMRLFQESNQVYLGTYTVEQFVDHVLASTQLKASSENDLFSLAIFLLNTISSEDERRWLYVQIALNFAKAGRTQEYQEYFSTAINSAESLPENKKEMFLRNIAVRLVYEKQYDRALEVASKADSARKEFPISILIMICVDAAKNDQKQIADTYFNRLLEAVQTFEPKEQRLSKLENIIENFIEIKSMELAHKAVTFLLTTSSKTIVDEKDRELYILIAGENFAKLGELDSARVSATRSNNPYFAYRKARLLNDIAHQYVAIKQIEKALALVKIIEELCQKTSEQPIAFWIFPDIARLYTSAGKPDKAFEISQAVANNGGEKSALLADIARYYALAGQEQRANQLFSESIQSADTIKYAFWKGRTYNAIAEQLLKAGKKDKALQILSLAIQSGQTIQASWSDIAKQYLQSGRTEEAQQALSYAFKATTEMENFYYLLELRQYEKAFDVADSFPNHVSVGATAKEAALKFIESNQYEKAIEIVQWLQNRSDGEEDEVSEIAQKFIEVGQFEPTVRIVDWFQSQAREGWNYSDYKLSEIGFKFAEVGQYEQALEISEHIRGNPNSDPLKATVVVGLAENGKLEESLNALASISSPQNKASAVAGIAGLFAKSGKSTKEQRLIAHKILAIIQLPYPYALEKMARDIFTALVKNDLTTIKKLLPDNTDIKAMQPNIAYDKQNFLKEWEHLYKVPWYIVWVEGTSEPMEKPNYSQFQGLRWLNFNAEYIPMGIVDVRQRSIPAIQGTIEACYFDAPLVIRLTMLRVDFMWRLVDIRLDIGGVHTQSCRS